MARALISVSDKTGIIDFSKKLEELNIEIISTGGTKKVLDEAGIKTISVEEVTGFPEMMDGRVKTLNPLIHGALLGLRENDEHLQSMKDHKITPIDLVVVNLYPFKETIQKPEVTLEESIENIDIGGPSMLRSAAKNYRSVTVVTDPADYELVLKEMEKQGQTTFETRQKLAVKVYQTTAGYDALIAQYLGQVSGQEVPETLTLTYDLKQTLRYGENNHQKAAFYKAPLPAEFSIAQAKQLHGKELSYNNIKDADSALRIVQEFSEPAAAAVKHMNPCGAALGENIEEAFNRCYESDPVSIFGGILAFNRQVTKALAESLSKIFLEIIIAPSFDDQAVEILTKKKNIRLLQVDFSKVKKEKEVTSVMGGLLVQDQDLANDEAGDWEVMTEKQPNEKQLKAMDFAWKVVKHVKSNAIVAANEKQTLGIGAGQMNRVASAGIALNQAKESGLDLSNMVLASDAFLPMDDTVALAGEYDVKAIVQTGGSLRDEDSVKKADEFGIPMLKTSIRHFKH